MLLHELAHISRYDYLINLLLTSLESLLFYHPAAWWISGVIRAERDEFEKSANDAVDKYTNDQRVIGNSLLAQAREHSVKVDELLASLTATRRRSRPPCWRSSPSPTAA